MWTGGGDGDDLPEKARWATWGLKAARATGRAAICAILGATIREAIANDVWCEMMERRVVEMEVGS